MDERSSTGLFMPSCRTQPALNSSPNWWTRSRRGVLACLPSCAAARAEGNAERFRRAAHSLKSNGNTFGALKLAALAREIELKGLDAEPNRDAAPLAALEAEFARAAAELKTLRNG